jgi:large subunit ribosomal protein L5
MKIRKGDTVHVLAGKDRGKEGRVIDARRAKQGDRREPQLSEAAHDAAPAQATERWAASRSTAAASSRRRAAARLARDARLPDVQAPDARRSRGRARTKGEGIRKVRVCKRADCGQDIDRYMRDATRQQAPRLKELYETTSGAPQGRARAQLGHAGAARSRRSRSTWASARRRPTRRRSTPRIEELTTIAGQRAQMRRAKKSVASFKIREGMPIGARVTLRGARMWEFLDRLISIALPRIRDFRGLSTGSFDGPRQLLARHPRADHLPEIDYDSIAAIRGLDVAITTTAADGRAGARAPPALGMPFAGEDGRREQYVRGQESLVNKQSRPSRYKVPQLLALQPVRAAARGVPQVRPVPDLPARARAPGLDPGMTKSSW